MKENFAKDHAFIIRDYLSPEAIDKIEFYEKSILFLKHIDDIDMASTAGNLALIFRRRKEKEKTIHYHSMSIDAYKNANKIQDYLIEVLNMATAYYEFNEVEKAIDSLRIGLKDAIDNNEEKLKASIAGNLASFLTKHGSKDSKEEIISCFEIEEKFFRSIGNQRDLAISLLNQIVYLHDKTEKSTWIPKLYEVSTIVRENGFKEFMSLLSKLEWIASKDQHPSENESESSIRKKFEMLLSEHESYPLSEIKLENGYYHIIFASKDNKANGNELHILYDENSPCKIQVYCSYRPSVYKKGTLDEVKKYVDWWNSIGEYSLMFDESKYLLQTHLTLFASTWENLTSRFNTFIKLWETDKVNTLALLIGILELKMCQSSKFKLLNPDM